MSSYSVNRIYLHTLKMTLFMLLPLNLNSITTAANTSDFWLFPCSRLWFYFFYHWTGCCSNCEETILSHENCRRRTFGASTYRELRWLIMLDWWICGHWVRNSIKDLYTGTYVLVFLVLMFWLSRECEPSRVTLRLHSALWSGSFNIIICSRLNINVQFIIHRIIYNERDFRRDSSSLFGHCWVVL